MNVEDKLNNVASHEQVIRTVKKYFKRIGTNSAITLVRILINGTEEKIKVSKFKTKHKAFVRHNNKLFNVENNEEQGIETYYIKPEIAKSVKKEIITVIDQVGMSIQDLDDNDEKWAKSQIDGEEVYEVSKYTTFQDIREKIDSEGKDIKFRYSFKKPDMEPECFENRLDLQMLNIHVNDNGEYFGFPLQFTYHCPECGHTFTKKEHEVASTGDRVKCINTIPKTTESGNVTYKRCNEPLKPDMNRTLTKDSYIHNINFIDEYGVLQKAEAITFDNLPKGHLKVVVQKMPRAYARHLVHIVDYEPIEKESMELPEKTQEHYLFTLVKQIDKYIVEQTGYLHYGYLPVKMAMVIQFASRYITSFKNNFHVSLSGSMSSGKSQFSRYWGHALYSQDCWSSNATSISIPKLRGTMENFRLFNKDYRYQYKGLLGETDLIIIDELKESEDVKTNLKQYALEPTYEYSKQGSNNQTFERTAQLLVTQNIDTYHLDQYAKHVKKIYISEDVGPVKDEDEPKTAWRDDIDLTLPLNIYTNKYLRYAIKRVRDMYSRNQINWIDGSELALKQRFFFYYYLGSDKTNEQLTKTIRENQTRNIIYNNIDLIRKLSMKQLREYIKSQNDKDRGKNDLEYFEKIDDLLKSYNKREDARTKSMSYAIIKLIRMLDGRDYCNDEDLRIFQYILESVDNKVEVADTAEFIIQGPTPVDVSDVDENVMTASNDFGQESALDGV